MKKKLLEYSIRLKAIAGKRHKGRIGMVREIADEMEVEARIPWWQRPYFRWGK